MFRDAQAWAAIRRAVLEDGVSKRRLCRETGIHWVTLQKILRHESPPGYTKRVAPATSTECVTARRAASLRTAVDRIVSADRLRPRDGRRGPDEIAAILSAEFGRDIDPEVVRRYLRPPAVRREAVWASVSNRLDALLGTQVRVAMITLLSIDPDRLPLDQLKKLRSALRSDEKSPPADTPPTAPSADTAWVLRLLLGKERPPADATDGLPDAVVLHRAVRTGGLKRRTRALVVLAERRGLSIRGIAQLLGISSNTVSRYARAYRDGGLDRLFQPKKSVKPKRDSQSVRDVVFEVLHSPPSAHDINRTTWKMDDLRTVLMERGVDLSRETIRAIIKDAGYRWVKAREVLTSNDPEYREKLKRVTAVLSAIKPGERFFSIDEFGPFAVKMKGGRVLAAPGETPSVPQFQSSKGKLIMTAALELSTNQMTHFYSAEKNTGEMLKLIDRLLDQYADCDRLYLSWDAASWHDSHALHARVAAVNAGEHRPGRRTPQVEFVPLPSRAQFLNVIESVFSGMAKAVIHNSDYHSIDEAQQAIDRHFRERNEHFRRHPKRAGKKIWGKEPSPSVFSAGNNCKDPKWCQKRS